MDQPTSAYDAWRQGMSRFFVDTASECVTHCVSDYSNKELTLTEKNCVNTCYRKQMQICEAVGQMMQGQ